MPAAYSINCPSCGSAFLATQTRPTSITTCPHCAYNAPLQAFQAAGMTTIGPATALPLRRRDPRTHYQQAPLLPTPTSPTPTSSPAHSLNPTPISPPSTPEPHPILTPPPLAPASSPASPIFPEIPVGTNSVFSNPPAQVPPPQPLLCTILSEVSPSPEPESQPSHHLDLAPPEPILPPLTPARPPQPAPDSFLPQAEFATLVQSVQKPSPTPFWRSGIGTLAFLMVVLAATYLLWRARSIEPSSSDSQPTEDVRPATPIATSLSSDLSKTPIPPPPNPTPETPIISEPPGATALDLELLSERVLTEGSDLFRQTLINPDSCLAHVDQFAKHRLQIASFFERHPKIVAEAFQKVPVAPRDLQTGLPVQMLQVTTSANPESGALLRFHISPDDRLLLDWPLFEETHEGALAQFVDSPSETSSRWFSVGLRRNHGLDLDESSRSLHHAFDIQAASKSLLGMPGIVIRDLPVGRYLDQKTEWRVIHMARLLLRPRTLDSGLKCVEIIDCEGLGLSQNRPEPQPNAKTVPEASIPAPSN